MALNQEKYLDDFTWKELNDVINFIRKAVTAKRIRKPILEKL